ncbi:MAG: TetR family transcriptional regulator [Rhodobacteraceae bacterium]|jgi:TetR/AcrR family transcriptional repressor of bet genes|nr:TetR family transcriptional regulator [Paracoccaceae bacterium]
MTESPPKFRREPAEKRKETLIFATLSLIAEQGVQGATVRAIAERAEVTQGLIRYHFSSKEDLISAAYEHHMNHMNDLTVAPAAVPDISCRARLVAVIEAGLMPPVVDPRSVSLWAGFINMVREDARMHAIHQHTYRDFCDRLEVLIGAALNESKIGTTAPQLRRLGIACNAVIDGLWMEGSALPGAFKPGELPQIGLKSIGAIIGMDLETTEDHS